MDEDEAIVCNQVATPLPAKAELWAIMLAAQAWCEPETSGCVMDARLADVFARMLTRLAQTRPMRELPPPDFHAFRYLRTDTWCICSKPTYETLREKEKYDTMTLYSEESVRKMVGGWRSDEPPKEQRG